MTDHEIAVAQVGARPTVVVAATTTWTRFPPHQAVPWVRLCWLLPSP